MEEELTTLKKQLAAHQKSDGANESARNDNGQSSIMRHSSRIEDHPEAAVVSLMDMKRGPEALKETRSRKLGNVLLSGDEIQDLFEM